MEKYVHHVCDCIDYRCPFKIVLTMEEAVRLVQRCNTIVISNDCKKMHPDGYKLDEKRSDYRVYEKIE